MNLKEFILEARAFELTPEEYKQITVLTDKFVKKYQNLSPEQIFKTTTAFEREELAGYGLQTDKKTLPRYTLLGTVKVYDHAIKKKKNVNVYIIYFYFEGEDEGSYRDEPNDIFLFHERLKHRPKDYIFEILSHEIIHAAQHYKVMSPEYQKAVTTKRFGPKSQKAYYTEPLEREAIISGIISKLQNKVNKFISSITTAAEKNNTGEANFYIRKLELLVKSIELFAKTKPENYFILKEIDIPQDLKERELFFKTVSKEPKLRREYQLKFLRFIDNTKEKIYDVLDKYKLIATDL